MHIANRFVRRSSPAILETLETRKMLSIATVASIKVNDASTIFGETVSVTVKVSATKGTATPSGTVELLDDGKYNGNAKGELDPKGYVTFSFDVGNALLHGGYEFSGKFLGTKKFLASTSKKLSEVVSLPADFTTAANGLETATALAGTGTATAQQGDSVTVRDTGYLSNGTEEYASDPHTPASATFTVEATPEQILTGFDEGVVGMKVGEIRDIVVPASLGNGKHLLFSVELVSINS